MGSSRRAAVAALAGVVGGFLATPLAAQDSSCTYDRCALRVEPRFWGERLVRGAGSERVAGLGLFPPRIALLEAAGDSVQRYYQSFRSHRKPAGWLTLSGIALVTVGVFAGIDDPGTGAALLLGGLAVTFAGLHLTQKSRDDLNRAIWWYNREFH